MVNTFKVIYVSLHQKILKCASDPFCRCALTVLLGRTVTKRAQSLVTGQSDVPLSKVYENSSTKHFMASYDVSFANDNERNSSNTGFVKLK